MDKSYRTIGLLVGSLVGVAIGGIAAVAFTTKTGKKFRRDAKGKFEHVKENIEEFLNSVETSVKKNYLDKREEWTDKAVETLESVKNHMNSLDLSEHKDIGLGIALGAILGVAMGAGGTLFFKNHVGIEDDGILNNIASHITQWKPIVIELEKMMKKSPQANLMNMASHKVDDVLEFAGATLKLWNNIKNKK